MQRSQHLTQTDPRVFGASYVASYSSVDGVVSTGNRGISTWRAKLLYRTRPEGVISPDRRAIIIVVTTTTSSSSSASVHSISSAQFSSQRRDQFSVIRSAQFYSITESLVRSPSLLRDPSSLRSPAPYHPPLFDALR